MTITVNRLHKMLTEAIAQGHGRAKVCVHKTTFDHPLEDDGVVVLDVAGGGVEHIEQSDDDGGWATDKAGRTITRKCFVIFGDDPKGHREGHVCHDEDFDPNGPPCWACSQKAARP